MVQYTAYGRIYEKFSFLTRLRGQNGRILRPSRAMSGSAGLSPSRNQKLEGSTLSVYARNLKKECAGLVAGPAVLTAEIKTAYLYSTSSSSHSHGAAPLFQYRRAERLLTRQTFYFLYRWGLEFSPFVESICSLILNHNKAAYLVRRRPASSSHSGPGTRHSCGTE
jgi:hypothetical protein